MALRFEDTDEIDEKVSDDRRETLVLGRILAIFTTVAAGAWTVIELLLGHSLHDAMNVASIVIAIGCLLFAGDYLMVPLYEEFRLRTKEIYGKVSAIEEAAIASREIQAELLEKLHAIEKNLDSLREG